MLCENCKKNIADTYFRKTVNGKTSEVFLCSECAKELGVTGGDDFFTGGFGFETVIPKLFSTGRDLQELVCPECGTKFSNIAKDGKVGCDKCYETFASRLDPVIARIHGNKKHVGKVPFSFRPAEPQNELEKAKAELEKAVSEERFEDAAALRDKIKEIEGREDK